MNVEVRDRELRNTRAALHVQGQLIDMMCEERDHLMRVVNAAVAQCQEWDRLTDLDECDGRIPEQYQRWSEAADELARVVVEYQRGEGVSCPEMAKGEANGRH
jgi:hypothetical protein